MFVTWEVVVVFDRKRVRLSPLVSTVVLVGVAVDKWGLILGSS